MLSIKSCLKNSIVSSCFWAIGFSVSAQNFVQTNAVQLTISGKTDYNLRALAGSEGLEMKSSVQQINALQEKQNLNAVFSTDFFAWNLIQNISSINLKPTKNK